ncbi:carbohydrate ABC transporter membrane protein 1, CUT1 family [Micromonospora citrea]|uniref:Carbohydrate ABC transporter membrane protein 1, CUT1 family n=1 Tax=Micromonospora citrea TaxID=47855 RepID=A0A1C6VY18_9ACTN|nr:sugar ABC transporter permease [Micromonospora citrea]SCL71097.1 carbohydrate ABC transporter membrane protein 1, CUT1 family [Micromonospora citrea]
MARTVTLTPLPEAARAARSSEPARRRRSAWAALEPLVWIGPAILLIIGVVLVPVVLMFRTAFHRIDAIGFDHGWAGWENFEALLREPALGAVVVRTLVWVVAVVAVTMACSLVLAQLFNQEFPGRRVARWALVAPWAASVFMTAVVFRWMLDSRSGLINLFLHDIGVLPELGTAQADWLGRPSVALWWMIGVAVFVSIPFTTYAILAGLQGIPADVYEAALLDGASPWRTYRSVTLPLLRPALLVAVLINIMNVFNSFPIIWAMTAGGPGDQTATTTIFMYQLKSSSIAESAAMSVVNFGIVIVLVALFVRASRGKSQVQS